MHPKREKGRLGDTKGRQDDFGPAVVFPAARAVPGTSGSGPQVLTRKLWVPTCHQGGWGPVGCIMRFPGHMDKNLECRLKRALFPKGERSCISNFGSAFQGSGPGLRSLKCLLCSG